METPELDARLLAELAFGLDRLELVNREREPAPLEALAQLREYGARRLRGEPVARILGEREFWGLRFALNAATLVPRAETEMLVQHGVQLLAGRHGPRLLDLGTGTGCVAIALLSELPSASAVAIDLVAEAARAAQANGERHAVARRLEVRLGSWYAPLRAEERFALIVSNPPYVEHATIATLAPEVREYDPWLALDGGTDGLDAYRAIVAGALVHLEPGGGLVVEIGAGQAPAVEALFRRAGLRNVTSKKDLAGLDRVVSGYHLPG